MREKTLTKKQPSQERWVSDVQQKDHFAVACHHGKAMPTIIQQDGSLIPTIVQKDGSQPDEDVFFLGDMRIYIVTEWTEMICFSGENVDFKLFAPHPFNPSGKKVKWWLDCFLPQYFGVLDCWKSPIQLNWQCMRLHMHCPHHAAFWIHCETKISWTTWRKWQSFLQSPDQ